MACNGHEIPSINAEIVFILCSWGWICTGVEDDQGNIL